VGYIFYNTSFTDAVAATSAQPHHSDGIHTIVMLHV